MSDILAQIKAAIGYTETPRRCRDCESFEPDNSTDNFGPGDLCGRNPDIKFRVREDAVCNKFSWRKE